MTLRQALAQLRHAPRDCFAVPADEAISQEERRIALADGGVRALPGATHADPTVEAIRWTICER